MPVAALDTGRVSPSTAVGTGVDCDGPTKVFSNDGQDTFCDKGKSHRFTGYDFSAIPSDGAIDGIFVEFVNAHKEDAGKDSSSRLRLSWDNGTTWTSYKNIWLTSTSDHDRSNGSATDTWGRAWTVSEIKNSFRLEWQNEQRTGNEGKDYLDWLPVTVYYSSGNGKPQNSTPLQRNVTSLTEGEHINFSANATDPEADNIRMTVCKTNSINDGYPGTCAASQTLCTSAAGASGSRLGCTNITNTAIVGSNTAYAFFCDDGSSTCNATAVTTTFTVLPDDHPSWTANLADSPDPITIGSDITYTGTAVDDEGDNYRMTVCRTDTINNGYPGTCAASQTLCTSGATANGSQASCAYTTVDTDEGTLTAYGFLCDAGSQTCNSTSTSTTTTVNPVFGWLNVSIVTPVQLTNVTLNGTFLINATVRCSGAANAKCGTVNATARYNASALPDTRISNTSGATPLYVVANTSSPLSPETLELGETWNVLLTVNYTDVPAHAYLIDVLFNSTTYAANIAANDTADRQVNGPPYGWLNVSLLLPSNPTNLVQNQTFTINGSVRCEGGVNALCGIVTALARYNWSSANPDTAINTSLGDQPLYNVSGALPMTVPSSLEVGEEWNVSWIVNFTAPVNNTGHWVDVLFSSVTYDGNVTANDTANALVQNVSASGGCTPQEGSDWEIDAAENCVIDGQSYTVDDIIIVGSGTVTVSNSNIFGSSCAVIPDPGQNIVIALVPPAQWANGC